MTIEVSLSYFCSWAGSRSIILTGVKTFKKDLLASVERRMGHFEQEEQFSMATALDPR